MLNTNNSSVVDWLHYYYKQLPVVIYTADATIKKNNLPVEEVLVKPVPAKTLKNTIERHIRKDSIKTKTKIDPIKQELWYLFGGGEKYRQLCEIYEQQIKELFNDLNTAKVKNDKLMVKRVLHRLKSNAGMIVDNPLLQIISKLDDALKNNNDEKLNSLFPELQEEMQKSLSRLREGVPQLKQEVEV